MLDPKSIVRSIIMDYRLPLNGYHGIIHWARVWENGLRIAEGTGANPDVVRLFALFHDSRRVNESWDRGHGHRGAELAKTLRGSLVHLDDEQFELLYEACRLHTNGHTTGDVSIMTYWDADRLDLGRVGITPCPNRLCTDLARDLIDWATTRAVAGYRPTNVLTMWGDPDTK